MAKKTKTMDLGHAEHSLKAQKLGIRSKVDRPLKVVFLGAGSGFFHCLWTSSAFPAPSGARWRWWTWMRNA